MERAVAWIVVECICRILGISTAAVLLGVGIETVLQGEFKSLGVYLLISAAGISVFELSYFIDLLLGPFFPCKSDSTLCIRWTKTARLGGFQKFLAYTLMSVVCFLHPVLVWHATIPGTMLVTTGFSYFIISKKKKTKLSKDPASQSERYADPSATLVDVTETGDTEQTYSFNNPVKKQKTTLLAYLESILKIKPSKENEPSMLHQSFPEDKPPINMGRKRKEHIEENAVTMIAVESESLYNHDMSLEENTSDTTPIIRP
ncbi:transmembrane protein 72 [Acipenser oxyrinchus oxyrinchus]|uniref:Transmembrane protein 72 n=1 Tax=Acipenser oxyrinchus oxyrinchus TaxID=40147 RepID=A0AAD8G653_ACIOX|nr:transmembrane protein 72 [Acipenser oxyrinchus oxyrinchus]